MKEIIKFNEKTGTNRTYLQVKCHECSKDIEVLKSEYNRGGGKICSRSCYYLYLKRIRPKGEDSWAWKGDKVGKDALHGWVIKNLGRPMICEHCNSTTEKKYEWANKSQKYKRDLTDWIRLCTKCHSIYDYKTRFPKWKKSVQKLGWKIKK